MPALTDPLRFGPRRPGGSLFRAWVDAREQGADAALVTSKDAGDTTLPVGGPHAGVGPGRSTLRRLAR